MVTAGRSATTSSPRSASKARMVGLLVVVALFATACTKSEDLGVVNGCDVSVEVVAYTADSGFDWVLLRPGEATFLTGADVPNKVPEDTHLELRITTRTVVVMSSDDLVDGVSGDWDREFVLSEEQCDQLT